MVHTINSAASTSEAAVLLTVAGFDAAAKDYWVLRQRGDKPWETLVPALSAFQMPANGVLVDALAPFGVPLRYRLFKGLAQVAETADQVVLPWVLADPDDPLSPRNTMPVFRDPLGKTLSTLRAPITALEFEWPTRSTRVSVIGSAVPRVVTDRRELKTGTFSVLTRTAKERREFLDLFLGAKVIHLRAPGAGLGDVDDHTIGLEDLFFHALDVSEGIFMAERPDWHVFDVAFAQTLQPSKYVESGWQSGWDYDDVKALHPSYNELRAALPDYDQMWLDPTLTAVVKPNPVRPSAIVPGGST